MVKVKKVLMTVGLLAALAACGSGGGAAKEFASGKVGSLTVSLANSDGVLRNGDQELTVTFKDASGKPLDVGAASLNFHMPAMGAMPVMNDAATLTTTSTPGVYHGKVKIEMTGDWQAQIAYEGPAGSGKGSFPVTAQ
jgi:hypothetical protein